VSFAKITAARASRLIRRPCNRKIAVVLETILLLIRGLALACRGHRELVLENLALRQQLNTLRRAVTRPRLHRRDRLFWILLAKTWRHWRDALVLVHPDTVVRWHRDYVRWRWTRVSRHRRGGRPTVNREIHTLVGDMATANPLWGAPRIHGELRKLGLDISERTVSRLIAGRRRPPSQTWRTFLTNHLALTVSMDFFTVPTLTGRVLFVLVILSHARRRVVHFNVVEHPTAAWTAQQVVNAFPDDAAPRWLLRDRDSITVTRFGAASRTWPSPRSSQARRVPGRIRTWSASSGRFGGTV
jgi:putative transposase